MSLLYSIRSRHVKNILSGLKKGELRKRIPPDLRRAFDHYEEEEKTITLPEGMSLIKPKYSAYIYCTKDDPKYENGGKVVCEVTIIDYEEVTKNTPQKDLQRLSKVLCISVEEILEYVGEGKGYVTLFNNELTVFEKPKELSEFTHCTGDKYGYCPACNLGGETIASWVETHEDLAEPGSTSWYCNNYIKRPPQSYYNYVRLGGDV